ncbi:hypothetical protein NDU88_006757 [Pleurodeles waltl]|uniref:Uncharacterized protein n=1 Tax=Pleurodeles waltl TaxID=8319 RepID=A0AAV7PJB3_PLEWA|nr:hypothetical protein NDU88_006757 [Pleurodeles waltl]
MWTPEHAQGRLVPGQKERSGTANEEQDLLHNLRRGDEGPEQAICQGAPRPGQQDDQKTGIPSDTKRSPTTALRRTLSEMPSITAGTAEHEELSRVNKHGVWSRHGGRWPSDGSAPRGGRAWAGDGHTVEGRSLFFMVEVAAGGCRSGGGSDSRGAAGLRPEGTGAVGVRPRPGLGAAASRARQARRSSCEQPDRAAVDRKLPNIPPPKPPPHHHHPCRPLVLPLVRGLRRGSAIVSLCCACLLDLAWRRPWSKTGAGHLQLTRAALGAQR